jgi:hypothetical protein
LLENPVLREAVAAEEARVLNQIRTASLADKELHTRLVIAMQISSAVTRNLWSYIQDGHEATQQINMRGRRID